MHPKGFFITGTGTGVGKTVVTACLLAVLKNKGIDAGVMKPVETGVDPACHSIANSDAEFLLHTAQTGDPPDQVCPYRFKTAASPWQAAMADDVDLVDENVIQDKFRQLAAKHDLMLVEGIGGLLVPIRENYMVADLIVDLQLPALVVSPFRLGAVNHTLLTLEAAKNYGVEVKGIIFNPLNNCAKTIAEKGQGAIIEKLSGTKILGECPFIDNLSPQSFTPELVKIIETQIDISGLMETL